MPTKQELTDFADRNNVDYPSGASKAEIENALSDAGYDPDAPESRSEPEDQVQPGTDPDFDPPQATEANQVPGTSSTQTSGASPGSEASTGTLRASEGMDTQAAEGVEGDPDGAFPPGWVIDASKDPGEIPSGATQQEANLYEAQKRAHEGFLSAADQEVSATDEGTDATSGAQPAEQPTRPSV